MIDGISCHMIDGGNKCRNDANDVGARLQKEINPAYLGVTLDRELKMNPFIAALKDK